MPFWKKKTRKETEKPSYTEKPVPTAPPYPMMGACTSCRGDGGYQPPVGGVLVNPAGQPYLAGPGGMMAPAMPGQSVMVAGAFDQGARFDGVARPTIPPPPPGAYMTPAQMAVAQGYNVQASQQPSNMLTGGSGGGYTVW